MTVPIRPDQGIVSPLERGHGISLDAGPDQPSFKDVLGSVLGDVSDLQGEAKDVIAAFLRGDPVELHQVMAASEEAAISLEVLVGIRNKLTDAYRTLMNLQT